MDITPQTLTEANHYCRKILPKVSRTFALNINALHGELHRAVLCSYLLCRIADTMEDTPILPSTQKQELLTLFSNLFDRPKLSLLDFRSLYEPFRKSDPTHPYHQLIFNSDKVFINYMNLREDFRHPIRQCVQDMCAGMIRTLAYRDQHTHWAKTILTISDLEQYCDYVAGTVGRLLTLLFAAYSSSIDEDTLHRLQKKDTSFGLGLQITNIIKDCHKDFQRGWCYIPTEVANRYNIPTASFFEKPYNDQAMMAINELIHKAVLHLDDAMAYTLLIPRREMRLRLFCLWPLFMAMETLLLCHNNPHVITGDKPVKISRRKVSQVLHNTSLLFWNDLWLKNRYEAIRNKIIKPAQ